MPEKPTPKLITEYPWTVRRARALFSPEQLGYTSCAWNHTKVDPVPATRIVVTENNRGHQQMHACCEECYSSVLKYVGRSDEAR
ncbi:MAG: hypothetical protein FJW86_12800 [Actinobacteria bacterium]|nr:hypothetical protein [Actinomycetota bacterium]